MKLNIIFFKWRALRHTLPVNEIAKLLYSVSVFNARFNMHIRTDRNAFHNNGKNPLQINEIAEDLEAGMIPSSRLKEL